MKTNPKCPILACSLVLLACGHASAQTLYSQPTTTDDAAVGLGWFSHSSPRPTRNFKHADQFTLDQPGEVGAVRWWGISEGIRVDDLSNVSSFTIEFFTSIDTPDGTNPGTLLSTETFDVPATDPQDTGRRSARNAIEYLHLVELDTAVSLEAGTEYFVAISAESTNPSLDGWQWQDADLVDGYSTSFSYATQEWLEFIDTDSAFELFAVPAPASLVLLAALGIRRRRAAWQAAHA